MERLDQNHEVAVEDRPRLVSLDRSSSWLTVSKALEILRNTAPTYFFVSRAL